MTIDEIIQKKRELDKELQVALSTMALSNDIDGIRKALKQLQNECPHEVGEIYNKQEGYLCPYCGRQLP